MFVITGATGALNGATVDHLLQRHDPREIVVVTRRPVAARRFADLGVQVRVGDYADPAGLPAAFAGADQLLLVSSNDPRADVVPLHAAAIDAAVTAGVGHVLYTSHQGAHPDNPFGPARSHAATEQLLEASGLPWTSLRNGFYAHTLQWVLGPWRQTGVVTVPGDGPVSWTAREDVAEAAAVVLDTAGAHRGAITLTAGAAPTLAEITDLAAEISGRPVVCEVMDEQEWVAARVVAGQPEPGVRFLLGMFQAARGGFFAGVDPLLGDLLGRDPRSVRDQLTVPAAD